VESASKEEKNEKRKKGEERAKGEDFWMPTINQRRTVF
jgi:hypothetical protein